MGGLVFARFLKDYSANASLYRVAKRAFNSSLLVIARFRCDVSPSSKGGLQPQTHPIPHRMNKTKSMLPRRCVAYMCFGNEMGFVQQKH